MTYMPCVICIYPIIIHFLLPTHSLRITIVTICHENTITTTIHPAFVQLLQPQQRTVAICHNCHKYHCSYILLSFPSYDIPFTMHASQLLYITFKSAVTTLTSLYHQGHTHTHLSSITFTTMTYNSPNHHYHPYLLRAQTT